MPRLCRRIFCKPWRVLAVFLLFLLFVVLSTITFRKSTTKVDYEDDMKKSIAIIQTQLDFLDSRYRSRQEDVQNIQNKLFTDRGANDTPPQHDIKNAGTSVIITPEVLLKCMTGTRAAAGIYTKKLEQLRTPFIYQLLPHLMNNPYSLKPAYHMRGGRNFCDIVIGIPTVKRENESYLLLTLETLLAGMSKEEAKSVLIIVMIGETDLEYVINTAKQIESMFGKHVATGLIEVISPSALFYPNFDSLPNTLGDSRKRVHWRTKQNLDTIYLMAYGQSKGAYYLMLEDDVLAKRDYIRDIRQFTAAITVLNPNWFYIEYCHVGGIGKLFRSADLIHFISYVQLFYNNMPIDWLLESYLADKVCTIDKTGEACAEAKLKIRPKYSASLFQHVGTYSSLKGKIQNIKDSKFGEMPTYFPHTNPPLKFCRTTIEEHPGHTLKEAYEGSTFFWGVKPNVGDIVEFWFKKPTYIVSYMFRSGNYEHTTDKFYHTTVEVLSQSHSPDANFTEINSFDHLGIAKGELKMNRIAAIRLKVKRKSSYWAILSEIELKEEDQPADS